MSPGVVKTGDLLLCVGNVSLVGLSLGQAQSVIDDMLKRDEVSTLTYSFIVIHLPFKICQYISE